MRESTTPGKLPIFAVIKEAAILPFRHFGVMAVSACIAVGGGLLLLGLVVIFGLAASGAESLSPSRYEEFAAYFRNNPGWPALFTLVLLLGVVLFIVLLSVGTFNVWVRLAVLQTGEAWKQSAGDWFRQIGMNVLNLIAAGFVCMLIGLVFLGGSMFLNLQLIKPFLLGLFTKDAAMFFGSVTLMYATLSIFAVAGLYAMCFVYARFSLPLVKGALGDSLVSVPPADLIKRHSGRFAVILCGVYIVGVIFKTLLSALGSFDVPVLNSLVSLFQFVTLFYAIAVIGAAHGLVFRRGMAGQDKVLPMHAREDGVPALGVFAPGEPVTSGDDGSGRGEPRLAEALLPLEE